MDEIQHYIDMLVSVLNKQIAELKTILDITRRQCDIADADVFDEDSFGATLSEKDLAIVRLNELDNGFVSVYNKVRSVIQGSPMLYKKEVENMQILIRQCTDLGNEIRTMELRNKERIDRAFARKKQEYSVKQNVATVVGKYNNTMRNVNMMGELRRFSQDK